MIPYEADFGGHEFFEASSMRKVGDKYYFIYSSQKNHELCYAVSDYPDRDFVFGGTIVSNGDVGVNGVSDDTRMNMTGTTHGSIIEINGQWYVFYHRLTHKSDYSRQACAEPICISPDGSIKQVEISSCGLNGSPLRAEGRYPATIACHITNGHMPHGSNKIFTESFPNVNHRTISIEAPTGVGSKSIDHYTERFISEVADGTLIRFRYFSGHAGRIGISYRGNGKGSIEINGQTAAIAPSDIWTDISVPVQNEKDRFDVTIRFKGTDNIEIKELFFA